MDPLDFSSFMAPPQQQGQPRCALRFFTEAVEIPGKSAEIGRPFYEDRDFVGIRNPGSRDEVVRRAEDKAKTDPYVAWAYDQWKKTKKDPVNGTPLDQVPFLTPSQIKNLQFNGVTSLEDLAGLSDTNIQRIGMGTRDIVNKAQAYLKNAADSSAAMKLQAELEKRDSEITALRRQVEELGELMLKMKKSA